MMNSDEFSYRKAIEILEQEPNAAIRHITKPT